MRKCVDNSARCEHGHKGGISEGESTKIDSCMQGDAFERPEKSTEITVYPTIRIEQANWLQKDTGVALIPQHTAH